jgi:rhodanese-related sulfurtransferase
MSAEEAPASELSLDPKRVEELLASGGELIDIRRDYEWEGGRIPAARHIEVNRLTAEAESIPKDRPVIFYCRTGNRSQMAAEAFSDAGYDAHNMAGGITAWAEAGLPLEPEDGEIRTPPPAS